MYEQTEPAPEQTEPAPEQTEPVSERIELVKNVRQSRYELYLGGQRVGLADYYERGGAVVIPHTETLPAFGGRGLAGKLVRFALDDIAAQGKLVDPACPFVGAYIRRNPEYAGLVG